MKKQSSLGHLTNRPVVPWSPCHCPAMAPPAHRSVKAPIVTRGRLDAHPRLRDKFQVIASTRPWRNSRTGWPVRCRSLGKSECCARTPTCWSTRARAYWTKSTLTYSAAEPAQYCRRRAECRACHHRTPACSDTGARPFGVDALRAQINAFAARRASIP